MTNKKTTLVLTMLTSLVLFILTFTQFRKLLEFLMPKIENIQYQTTDIGSQFKLALFFSIVIGLTPIFLYLTWRFGRIEKTKRRTYCGLIVIVFMAISVALRQYLIKSTFSGLTNLKSQTGETIYSSFATENLNFEYYVLGGLILGCIVSYLFLKDKEAKSL
jgi:hypothetical protein